MYETSCVGTPQQNGVADMKNRNILENAKSLLLENNVLQMFWDNAVTMVVYLINRTPSKVINFKTPLKVLSTYTIIPSILNLSPKKFGCVAYVHIQKHLRSKVEAHTEKCIFLGFGA